VNTQVAQPMTPPSSQPRIRLIVSDLDGTLLPVAGGDGGQRFATWWNALLPSSRPLLAYCSGRLCGDVLASVPAAGLPAPDYIIGGVGTALIDGQGRQVPGFQERFRDGWDRSLVQEVMSGVPGIEAQPARFQNPFKSSWFLRGVEPARIAAIAAALAAVELRVRVVYSSDRDLDILPGDADKGHAVAWLCTHLGLSTDTVVVAGDTENDLAMFQVAGVRGIVVANARVGLVQALAGYPVHHATAPEVDGVIEGLEHYGLHSSGLRPSGLHPDGPHPAVRGLSAGNQPSRKHA